MTVVKRTTNELVIEDSDLQGYTVRFARDHAGEQIVSVQTLDRGPAGLDHADILAALSWLADAAGVERYVPDQPAATCDSRTGDVPCLLAPGHPGWHKGLGAWWSNDELGATGQQDSPVAGDEDAEDTARWIPEVICGATDPTTDLPCLLEPEHDGHLHRHLGTVWSR